MAKRFCAVLLAAAMLVTMLAAGVTIARAAVNEIEFTVGDVTAEKGDVVEIPVSVSENSHIVNMDIYVEFDPAQLAIDKSFYETADDPDSAGGYAVNTEILKGGWMYLGNEVEDGCFRFVAATGGSGITAGGELIRLAFEVLTDEAEKIAVTVRVDPCVVNTGDGDEEWPCHAVNGGVTVTTYEMGDYDQSGVVNMRDIMQLYKAVSEGNDMTDYQFTVSDYDGNGVVNMRDVMKIYQIVSGAA